MFSLLKYLGEYKKESVLGPIFKLLEATFELFVPLVVASIIDDGIANDDTAYVLRMCLVLVALTVAGLGLSVTAQYFAAKASVGFVTRVREVLFTHIQNLSYSELDVIGTSTMLTRMTSDMNQVQSGVNMTLRLLLRSPFIVLGAMVMAFTIDVKSALVFAVTIPLLSVVVFGIMLVCIPLYKKVQGKLDAVLSTTRANLKGVRVIRAFCREKDEIDSFKRQNAELTDEQKFVGRISSLMNPVTYLMINTAIIILVYVGAIRVNQGVLTQGLVIALWEYMSQILTELIKFAGFIVSLTKAVACGNRIQEVLEIETSLSQPDSPVRAAADSEYAVEFDHVSLRYLNSGDNALTDINFAVRRGETVGIIGGTGSGKTSLVNMIPRFYDASVGEVRVNGVNVRDYAVSELRDRIGVVPQRAVLFKGTIRENLQWGNDAASDEQINEAAAAAQASNVIGAKDGGLDCVVAQGGKNFSGGQKQRLTIARALVKRPEILIMDDSASALDFATDAALRKSIKNMSRSMTVFIVSQRTSSIRHADKIIVLDNGAAVGIGSHDELLQSCDVYREIYNSQFKQEAAEEGRA